MSIIKRIFGINPDERTDVPNGLRGTGVAGGKGIYDEYFNQMLFEVQADHIIDTEANVKLANDPRGTCYYDSTSASFLDRNDANVTFSDGDRIVWKGLDALSANIDISAIDDLEHIMWYGSAINIGAYLLILGENQRGELNITGTSGLASLLVGSSDGLKIKTQNVGITDSNLNDLFINNVVNNSADFAEKNLKIDVSSSTEVDFSADVISVIGGYNKQKILNNVSGTFDITTDLMASTSEKSSTRYRLWIDSDETLLMVPDISNVTTAGTTGTTLVSSTSTFVTDKIVAGDIIYNLLDKTESTIVSVDSETQLTLSDSIFAVSDQFRILLLSPTGLNEYKAMIGSAYNNSSGDLNNSAYTHAKPPAHYSEGLGDFTVTGSGWTTGTAIASVYQSGDNWRISLNIKGSTSGAQTLLYITVSGIAFNDIYGLAARFEGTSFAICNTNDGSGIITCYSDNINTNEYYISGDVLLQTKPTFHI